MKTKIIFTVFFSLWGWTLSLASTNAPIPPANKWSFLGLFGTFDLAEKQRGFQVYKEVCSTCHSLNQISYRHLKALGYTPAQVKALAAEVQVMHAKPNDQGEMYERPGLPADKIKAPYLNEQAARKANNGALPPDLSLMVKARKYGADYVKALLLGYEKAPADFIVQEGLYYNHYFPGHQIAMTPPLVTEGQVTYGDGTQATIEQMAYDVAVFLAWTAEPELEARKRLGVKVSLYLIVMSGFLYVLMKRIWARLN